MKKKRRLIVTIVIVLLVLFFPIPRGVCNDGGTRDYVSLTYRLIVWNRIMEPPGESTHEYYHKTSVYWFPDNRKSIDELWKMEWSGK